MRVLKVARFTKDEWDTILKADAFVNDLLRYDVIDLTQSPDWPAFRRMLTHIRCYMSERLEFEPDESVLQRNSDAKYVSTDNRSDYR